MTLNLLHRTVQEMHFWTQPNWVVDDPFRLQYYIDELTFGNRLDSRSNSEIQTHGQAYEANHETLLNYPLRKQLLINEQKLTDPWLDPDHDVIGEKSPGLFWRLDSDSGQLEQQSVIDRGKPKSTFVKLYMPAHRFASITFEYTFTYTYTYTYILTHTHTHTHAHTKSKQIKTKQTET
jgi:hypothetical protein